MCTCARPGNTDQTRCRLSRPVPATLLAVGKRSLPSCARQRGCFSESPPHRTLAGTPAVGAARATRQLTQAATAAATVSAARATRQLTQAATAATSVGAARATRQITQQAATVGRAAAGEGGGVSWWIGPRHSSRTVAVVWRGAPHARNVPKRTRPRPPRATRSPLRHQRRPCQRSRRAAAARTGGQRVPARCDLEWASPRTLEDAKLARIIGALCSAAAL